MPVGKELLKFLFSKSMLDTLFMGMVNRVMPTFIVDLWLIKS